VDSLAVVLALCRFPRNAKEEFTKLFLGCRETYAYFTLDLDRRTFSKNPISGTVENPVALPTTVVRKETRAASRLDASRFFPHMEDPEKASLLHDLILPHLVAIGPDFTIEMLSNKTGRNIRVSLLDYLDVATSEKKAPSDLMKSFHNFISGLVSLPSCLLVNKRLSSGGGR
jgi:hypothetical protein